MKRISAVSAALCLLLTAACGSGSDGAEGSDARRIVFVNYGGEAVAAAEKGWLEPFKEATGIDYKVDSPFEPAKVQAMVDSGRTTWDIVTVEPATGALGCGKIYEKRDPDIDMSGMDPRFVNDDCGVPVYPQAVTLVYNKKLFSGDNVPTSITDFMDTKKFPGKRIAYNYITTLPPLLMADGVDKDSLYPLDFDRAAKAIDKLGNDLTLHADLATEVEKLAAGDFAMCLCFSGRVEVAARTNPDLGMVWNGIWQSYTMVYAVKKSESPKSQQAFLKWIADPAKQAPYYQYMAYPSAAKDAGPEVPDKFKPFVASAHKDEIGDSSAYYDLDYMLENQAEVVERWTEMTAG